MAVKPIPEGYHTFTPYFVVEGATDFIDFLKKAFGGNEVYRFPAPGGKIGHAEVRVGDSVLMLADTNPEYPPTRIGSYLYVTDVDATYKKALTAGGQSRASLQATRKGSRRSIRCRIATLAPCSTGRNPNPCPSGRGASLRSSGQTSQQAARPACAGSIIRSRSGK